MCHRAARPAPGRWTLRRVIGRDAYRCTPALGNSKVASRLTAAGDLKRLNVGRRGHLSFKDGGVDRPLHLCHRPLNIGQLDLASRTTLCIRGFLGCRWTESGRCWPRGCRLPPCFARDAEVHRQPGDRNHQSRRKLPDSDTRLPDPNRDSGHQILDSIRPTDW